MTTIKGYTNIEQSRKLAEILPLESADMCLTFVNNVWNPVWGKADDIYQLQKDCYEPDYIKNEYIDIDEFEPKVVPCWSLAALINILPNGSNIVKEEADTKNEHYMCTVGIKDDIMSTFGKNPVDACVTMIEKLHEQNLLLL